MKINIEKLHIISGKDERIILGLMSGTSLDGLDLALCKIQGHGIDTVLEVIKFTSIPYTTLFVKNIQKVFAKEVINLADLSGLNALIAREHAAMVLETLAKWNYKPEDIDILASHGQTVYHGPQSLKGKLYPNHTLQIGDGDHLAVLTGILTCSDFRQKHIAAGGEGAPLVQYGDYLLFSDPVEDRILLNLGGIANFTYVPSQRCLSQGGKVQATDLGPANTMINQFMQKRFGLAMDQDAAYSSRGKVQPKLLARLLAHDFYSWKFPKTTGPELFNLEYLNSCIQAEGVTFEDADILYTLTQMTVEGIVQGVESIVSQYGSSPTLYVSGGGMHNPLMMRVLEASLPQGILLRNFDQKTLGLVGDAKEAALFAVLANETVAGDTSFSDVLKDAPPISMGKISFPT